MSGFFRGRTKKSVSASRTEGMFEGPFFGAVGILFCTVVCTISNRGRVSFSVYYP